MTDHDHTTVDFTDRLAADGYWPAQAARALREGTYSRAVRLCREFLAEQPNLVSGRLIYAEALYRSGQLESATEEFHRVLALDPEHEVALKRLGDIRFASGDYPAALAKLPPRAGDRSALPRPVQQAGAPRGANYDPNNNSRASG